MGTMHMKWKLFFLDALFWIFAFMMKIPFDYYIICQPSVAPVSDRRRASLPHVL
jgi:1,3-beta-glucan synthase